MLRSIPCSLLAALFFAALSSGRQVEQWPYSRLMSESDVAVIATVTSFEDNDSPAVGPLLGMPVIGQTTTFEVQATLKGDPVQTIRLMHFRQKEGTTLVNGPMLAHFRTHGPLISPATQPGHIVDQGRARLSDPAYLLFLKKTSEGAFEPVSGQFDSELSVKEIYRPIPAGFD